jgi:hypothetical protein
MPIGRRSAALSSMTRPKLVLRPIRTTRASATTSKFTGRKKCVVWSMVAVPGGRTGQHHRGICQRHERLRADHRTVAADFSGIGEPYGRAWLPVGQRARRPHGFDAFDQQRQILHPLRKNFGHQAPRRLQAERHPRRRKPVHPAHGDPPNASQTARRPFRPVVATLALQSMSEGHREAVAWPFRDARGRDESNATN